MSLWPDILDALDGVTRQRVAWVTGAGTWAAPGTGYPSWVIQNADEGLVFEVPAQGPWSFGFVNAPNPNSPSYVESVAIAKDWAINWLLRWAGLWGLGGYSQGGQWASEVYEETYPGGQLEHMADRFVGGFSIGDPMRPYNITGGGQRAIPDGGIAPKLVAHPHPKWWYETNPGDLYTCTPGNGAGTIIRLFYSMAVKLGLAHPDVMLMAIAKGVLELFLHLAGLDQHQALAPAPPTGSVLGALAGLSPAAGGGVLSMLAPLSAAVLPAITGPLAVLGPLAALASPLLANATVPSLFNGSLVALLPVATGVADAIEAAVLGLQFLFAGTGPHITYDTTDATPGVNHIAHAIGHVNTISRDAISAWPQTRRSA